MDYFDVPVESSDVLRKSHLIADIDANDDGDIVALVDGYAYPFSDVAGGFNPEKDAHLVQLLEPEREPAETAKRRYELHCDDRAYSLNVGDAYTYEDNGTYALCLRVIDYEIHPYSFRDALLNDIDGRETRYTYDGDYA